MLEVQHLTVRYGALTIVDDVSFAVRPGQWLMIAGPNGAGKSTLINALSRGIPYTGTVLLHGQDTARLRPRTMAQHMGVLAQSHAVGYAFSVEEVVNLGRYAHSGGFLAGGDDQGEARVHSALERTGMLPFRSQSVLTLSGGELQRAFLAQVLAQDPRLLLLDEPTNHLDLSYQQQTFALIQRWVAESGRAVISVVHDLSLARAYGTDVLLLNKGRAVAYGPTREVLTRARLQEVYAIDVYAWMRDMLSQWNDDEDA